jgi:predicted esterase
MTRRTRYFVAGAALVLALALGLVIYDPYSRRYSRRTQPQPAVAMLESCAPSLTALPGGGCWAAPALANPPVIIYLHGVYDKNEPAAELERQTRLARRAVARGFAVLSLRGEEGACSDATLRSSFCWPSNAQNAARGPEFVARWVAPLHSMSAYTANPRRFVLGFSNGAYFSGLLATRAWFDATAFVVSSGGPVQPIRNIDHPRPILALVGDDEAGVQETLTLDAELARAHWPHDTYARAGGHDLTDGDIDAALDFFERVGRGERVPLSPPLKLHRPHLRVPDAGAPAATEADAAAAEAAAAAEEDAAP